MKKAITGVSALVLLCALASPATSQIVAGGGLIMAASGDVSEVFDLGLQGGLYVDLSQALPGLRVGGDIEFYFPESQTFFGVRVSANLLAINGNVQYFFVTQPGIEVYGLGGLSWTRASMSADGFPNGNGFFNGNGSFDDDFDDNSESDSDIGLNLGAGAEIPMGFGRIYAELKFVTGTYDRLVFGGGLRLGL